MTEFSGVKPNPVVAHAREGVRVAREDGDVWDFYDRTRTVTDALPILAVQTLPASSSEMNMVSVMTDDEAHVQDGMVEGVCRAVINAMERLLADPADYGARATISHTAPVSLS